MLGWLKMVVQHTTLMKILPKIGNTYSIWLYRERGEREGSCCCSALVMFLIYMLHFILKQIYIFEDNKMGEYFKTQI